jgi:hypothetical protein
MQTVRVNVDMLRSRRVKLHHAFLVPPEQLPDAAHFLPRRRAALMGHADMLPAVFLIAAAADDEQIDAANRNN